jgi:hypothetical protein
MGIQVIPAGGYGCCSDISLACASSNGDFGSCGDCELNRGKIKLYYKYPRYFPLNFATRVSIKFNKKFTFRHP